MTADVRSSRRWLRIALYAIGGFVGFILLVVAGLLLIPFGQRVDSAWRPSLASPRNVKEHPLVCFDEGHYNAHKASGRYRPLARLVEADGYPTRPISGRFTPGELASCRILVVANAAGGDRLRLGPINLPIHFGGKREDPAFRADEIARVKKWVEKGGALLLIADHVPFGHPAPASLRPSE